MRIINGLFKGRRIPLPKKLNARPTTDFAKESLFNILENRVDLEGIKVLDLFSGTGNISLEFCSRGAGEVHAVDFNKLQVKTISQIAKDWKAPIKAIHIDVFEFIKIAHQKYDIIFVDPPYDHKSILSLPDLIFEKELLEEDGILIVEHSKSTQFKHPNLKKVRKYGKVHFSFFDTFEQST